MLQEVQYGILQITETLAFLHSSAVNLIHRNICCESIYITNGGRWKIAGFGFSSFAAYNSDANTEKLFTYQEFDSVNNASVNLPVQPQLAYVAPELVAGQHCTPAADMFSLACTVSGSHEQKQHTSNENANNNKH